MKIGKSYFSPYGHLTYMRNDTPGNCDKGNVLQTQPEILRPTICEQNFTKIYPNAWSLGPLR